VLPDRSFAEVASQDPYGGPQPASGNPYASPAAAYSPLAAASGERPGLPWEIKGVGFVSWWETAQLCLSETERAFSLMRQEGGFGPPLMYAVWGLLLGYFGQMVWSVPGMLLEIVGGGPGNQQVGMEIVTFLILAGLFAIGLATLGLLVSAAITHACLMLVGGARLGFETTYRVLAFSAGSVAWLNVIPCFGPLIYFVMSFVCPIQGLAAAHGTTAVKAAAAVLLPLVLGAILLVVGLVALIAALANM
jgi:hypothetical protein